MPAKFLMGLMAFSVSHVLVMYETLQRRSKIHAEIRKHKERCEQYVSQHANAEAYQPWQHFLNTIAAYEPLLQRKGDMLVFLDKQRKLYEYIASKFGEHQQNPALVLQLAQERCRENGFNAVLEAPSLPANLPAL